ncbi:MAG: thioether cross-link-forming SCIFF peptide maturase, partial [Clostridia bacterium]|nr:thioether cross-link-forming SCIFF peptide maturase [Clostridia bacterium]
MIHQYKLNGYNIVLDVCSGSVHVVDDAAYDLIADFERLPKETLLASLAEKYAQTEGVTPEELAECYEQICQLKEEGSLFAPDTFEPMAGDLKRKTAGVVKALCLHVAHTCNL